MTTVPDATDPYWKGFAAYARGETIDLCGHPRGSASRNAWIDGWELAKLVSALTDENVGTFVAREEPLRKTSDAR